MANTVKLIYRSQVEIFWVVMPRSVM